MFVSLSITITLLAILLAASSQFALASAVLPPSGPRPAVATTRDKCRDEQGDEICINYNSDDTRVNQFEAQATIVGYCQPDGGVEIWGIIDMTGRSLYRVSGEQVLAGLKQAAQTGGQVILGDAIGKQLVALPRSRLVLRDLANGYAFEFPSARCGLAIESSGTVATASAPTATASTTTAKNAPQATPAATLVGLINVQAIAALNVRSKPAFTGRRIGGIIIDTNIAVLGRSADLKWLKVSYPDGVVWVWAAYTSITYRELRALPVVK
jgi:hypothetical protein